MNPPFGNTDDRLRRGSLLLKAGQFREALNEYESILRAEPENAEAHLGMARSHYLFVIGVNEKLIEYKFVEVSDNPQYPVIDINSVDKAPAGTMVCILTGDMQRILAEKQIATAEYQQVLRINPGHPDALAELGDITVSSDPARGFLMLQQALKVNPDNPLANWIIGEDHLNKGHVPEAFRHLGTAVRSEPDNHKYWFSFGRICEKSGLTDQAIDAYLHVIAIRPDHRDALFNLGTAFFERKDLEMARKYWGEFLFLEPGSADALYIHRIFPDLP
jgi:tetratricopeptide (TPR) repeat protein